MLEAGEDPRFIMRRLFILASEDIGLADPNALVQVAAASQALTWVGLPEGRYHLAQATLYLALAPKSNSTAAYFRAEKALEDRGATQVPKPLQDAHRDKQGLGHGEDYLYPHDFPGHWVAQDYLPEELAGSRFYEPGPEGAEPDLVARWRAFRRQGERTGRRWRTCGGITTTGQHYRQIIQGHTSRWNISVGPGVPCPQQLLPPTDLRLIRNGFLPGRKNFPVRGGCLGKTQKIL